jgi:hypothetical protein
MMVVLQCYHLVKMGEVGENGEELFFNKIFILFCKRLYLVELFLKVK